MALQDAVGRCLVGRESHVQLGPEPHPTLTRPPRSPRDDRSRSPKGAAIYMQKVRRTDVSKEGPPLGNYTHARRTPRSLSRCYYLRWMSDDGPSAWPQTCAHLCFWSTYRWVLSSLWSESQYSSGTCMGRGYEPKTPNRVHGTPHAKRLPRVPSIVLLSSYPGTNTLLGARWCMLNIQKINGPLRRIKMSGPRSLARGVRIIRYCPASGAHAPLDYLTLTKTAYMSGFWKGPRSDRS